MIVGNIVFVYNKQGKPKCLLQQQFDNKTTFNWLKTNFRTAINHILLSVTLTSDNNHLKFTFIFDIIHFYYTLMSDV